MLVAHLEALRNDERVESLETSKARIKNYTFSRDFSFVLGESNDKSRKHYGLAAVRATISILLLRTNRAHCDIQRVQGV